MPRSAVLRKLRSPGDGAAREILDEALVLWFPGPHSYTGEDCAELQLHGSPAVTAAVAAALVRLGATPAAPGAFTRRAFDNHRLDLPQAEAIADLIDAETEAQRRQALAQLGDGVAEVQNRWRDQLLDAAALVEAMIDFPEEDLPGGLGDQASQRLTALADELEGTLAQRAGEIIRDGFRVALVGLPNAGKSSLLNALVGRSAAMVTPVEGTTRDVIEAPLVVSGRAVVLADMAGLGRTTGALDAEADRRARSWATSADLRLFIVDGSAGTWSCALFDGLPRSGDLVVLNKADLPERAAAEAARGWADRLGLFLDQASAIRGDVAAITRFLQIVVVDKTTGRDTPLVTRARHRRALGDAVVHLRRAVSAQAPEIVGEEIRQASACLTRITGRFEADDVLDRVFATFCIGK